MSSTIPRSRNERNATVRHHFVNAWRSTLVVACSWALVGCNDGTECNINSASRMLGGPGVIDCKVASAGESSQYVDTCAVETYNARGTFRALYERDDGTLDAIVHAAGDTYHILRMRAEANSVEQADCEGAHVVSVDGRTYVQCDDPTPFRVLCP